MYNFHNLLHLTADAENFGALDNFSAFPFENFMTKIKQMVRSHSHPLQQVAKRMGELKYLPKNKVPIKSSRLGIYKVHRFKRITVCSSTLNRKCLLLPNFHAGDETYVCMPFVNRSLFH